MRILILGGDGYLGWPTAMHFAARGHDVCIVDNYYRRNIAEKTDSDPLFHTPRMSQRCELFASHTGKNIESIVCDLNNAEQVFNIYRKFHPDTIIHYAEQPSAPYSMIGFNEAKETFDNNLGVTFNCIWAMKEITPKAHLIKLGTMGEYGTPNIDIEEGWIDINHNGRSDRLLFPRQASSLYHTTKVLDTDLLWFYVRTYDLQVTDLMQGPVYGLSTDETDIDIGLYPNFHYDDMFGTVINRFLVQAVAGIPLTVYGQGGQTRGYLNLRDTLNCVELACLNPPGYGEMSIYNQLTETFTVNDIAARIKAVGDEMNLEVKIENIPNPRKEAEDHYYNPKYTGLLELGLKPNYLTDEVIERMLSDIVKHSSNINKSRIFPRVRWSKASK